MPAKIKADRYRQWSINAATLAMQVPDIVDRETLLMIARLHLAAAIKADRRKISGPMQTCAARAAATWPGPWGRCVRPAPTLHVSWLPACLLMRPCRSPLSEMAVSSCWKMKLQRKAAAINPPLRGVASIQPSSGSRKGPPKKGNAEKERPNRWTIRRPSDAAGTSEATTLPLAGHHEALATAPQRRSNAGNLVRAELVHDHDIPAVQRGNQHLLDIGEEGLAVDRAIEHTGSNQAILAHTGDEGRGIPVPVRYSINQPTAHFGPAVEPGHIGFGPGLVDEDQPGWIKLRLAVTPFGSSRDNVRPILLTRPERLFFSVSPSSFNVCQISPTLAET